MFLTCYSANNKRDIGKQGHLQIYDPYVNWCAVMLVPESKEEEVSAKA